MSDQKVDEYSSLPQYPGTSSSIQQPQTVYINNGYPQQQSPYVGQQPLPGMQTQFQQTPVGQPQMVPMQPQMMRQPSVMSMGQVPMQPQMTGQPSMMSTGQVPMQPQMVGQPSMMSMNANMGVGAGVQQQPLQPQTTAVMMNVMMPGAVPGPNHLSLCELGQHAFTKRYGACGIITAILLFPIGIFAIFLDVEEYCVRCGTRA